MTNGTFSVPRYQKELTGLSFVQFDKRVDRVLNILARPLAVEHRVFSKKSKESRSDLTKKNSFDLHLHHSTMVVEIDVGYFFSSHACLSR